MRTSPSYISKLAIRLFRIISIPSKVFLISSNTPRDFDGNVKHWTSGVNEHNENSNPYVAF